MINRNLISLVLFSLFLSVHPTRGWAQLALPADNSSIYDDTEINGGFAKPYTYERKAYGYDPEGVDYHESQSEDFQVIFISSMPFTAGASFLLTGLTSLALDGNFQVGGDYFLPFLGGTFVGATTIACVSVLTNPYPPPGAITYLGGPAPSRSFVFSVPLITAKF